MRLINVHTLGIEEFFDDGIPEYSILSHTWGVEEASFQQWMQHPNPVESSKRGFVKVLLASMLSRREGFNYIWVDTVCIDKTNSTELTEAINSMFHWYRDSAVCYAYLEDFDQQENGSRADKLRGCRWFTRGWTLQELIAPSSVQFLDRTWAMIGTKAELTKEIANFTSISEMVLHDSGEVSRQSIAQRMSWISHRLTTRKEDIAYCMLGIFDVNMPCMYGEGKKAFIRLQEVILNNINDHTIFCWTWPEDTPRPTWMPFLAPNPAAFRHSGVYIPDRKRQLENMYGYSVTNNLAIQMRLQTVVSSGVNDFALLDVRRTDNPSEHAVAIPLVGLSPQPYYPTRPRPVWRADYSTNPVVLPPSWGSEPQDLSFARPGLESMGGDLIPGEHPSLHGDLPQRKVSQPFAAMVLHRVDSKQEQVAHLSRPSKSCSPFLFYKPTRSPRVWHQTAEVRTKHGDCLVHLAVLLRSDGKPSWRVGLDSLEPYAPVSVIEHQVARWGSKVELRVCGQDVDDVACLEFAGDGMDLIQDMFHSSDGLMVRPASFSVYSPRSIASAR